MKKTLSIKVLILCALCVSSFHFQAQEYLVTVNPITGVHSKTLAIASTKSVQVFPGHTTIDKVRNRYFFKGIDWGGVEKLYIVNGNTSATNREVAFPSANLAFSQVGNLQFDDSTGNIYCTGLHIVLNTVFLLKMDTLTALVATIAAIPNIYNAEGNQSTYDQKKHRYMFVGQDPLTAGGATRYLSMNVLTGAVIANVPGFGAYPCTLRFNNATNKLYAFKQALPSIMYPVLAEFDAITAAPLMTLSANAPPFGTVMGTLWQWFYAPNLTTIDEINNRYTIGTFIQTDNNGVSTYSLCTISLANSSLISKPIFPQGLNIAGENILELHYNNNNGVLYGLHWKFTNNPVGLLKTTMSGENNLFPNPTNGIVELKIDNSYRMAKIQIVQASALKL